MFLDSYVDDSSIVDFSNSAVSAGPSAQAATNAFFCLTESSAGGIGTDDRVSISILAVIASTGEVIYDDFVDTHLRTELEVRRPLEADWTVSLMRHTDSSGPS